MQAQLEQGLRLRKHGSALRGSVLTESSIIHPWVVDRSGMGDDQKPGPQNQRVFGSVVFVDRAQQWGTLIAWWARGPFTTARRESMKHPFRATLGQLALT